MNPNSGHGFIFYKYMNTKYMNTADTMQKPLKELNSNFNIIPVILMILLIVLFLSTQAYFMITSLIEP